MSRDAALVAVALVMPVDTGAGAGGWRWGNKEWPDDWRVGNGSALAGLGCIMAPIISLGLGLLVKWLWG